jgi:DNA polymerase
MRGSLQVKEAAAADAYLAWWRLAGVDCAIAEEPINWLRPRSGPVVAAPPAAANQQPGEYRPESIDKFREWLAADPTQPERRWAGAPILPSGDLRAPLMIVTDMPDPADMDSGMLFADRAGQLFDAMLRALGLTRESVHLASLFLSRPAGGMMDADDIALATKRMRTHVSLAVPRRLLLLGDRTKRALLASDVSGGPDPLPAFNHDGGTVPAIATFHPRLLLSQPGAKAECWRALQSLIEDQIT